MTKTSDALISEHDSDSDEAVANPAKSNIAKGKNQAMESKSDIAPTMLPADYRPSESEEFMNPMQLLYFRKKLEAWKAELLDDASDTAVAEPDAVAPTVLGDGGGVGEEIGGGVGKGRRRDRIEGARQEQGRQIR